MNKYRKECMIGNGCSGKAQSLFVKMRKSKWLRGIEAMPVSHGDFLLVFTMSSMAV